MPLRSSMISHAAARRNVKATISLKSATYRSCLLFSFACFFRSLFFSAFDNFFPPGAAGPLLWTAVAAAVITAAVRLAAPVLRVLSVSEHHYT